MDVVLRETRPPLGMVAVATVEEAPALRRLRQGQDDLARAHHRRRETSRMKTIDGRALFGEPFVDTNRQDPATWYVDGVTYDRRVRLRIDCTETTSRGFKRPIGGIHEVQLDVNGDPIGRLVDCFPEEVLDWLMDGLERLLPAIPPGGSATVHSSNSLTTLSDAELHEVIREATAAIDAAYWTFTHTVRGTPPAMVVPEAYAQRTKARAELRQRIRSRCTRGRER